MITLCLIYGIAGICLMINIGVYVSLIRSNLLIKEKIFVTGLFLMLFLSWLVVTINLKGGILK